MKTKTKRILIGIAVVIIFALGVAVDEAIRYHFFPQPTPPEPSKPSQQIVIEGKPGTITIEDEKFYNDFYSCIITSTGYGKIEHQVPRPTKWYPDKPKSHFIGFGPAIAISNGQFMYGGYISYRYRVIKDISIQIRPYVVANELGAYDVGIQAGVEFGIK